MSSIAASLLSIPSSEQDLTIAILTESFSTMRGALTHDIIRTLFTTFKVQLSVITISNRRISITKRLCKGRPQVQDVRHDRQATRDLVA